jgi:hypothetical protein
MFPPVSAPAPQTPAPHPPAPQTYILHTVAIALVLAIAMVLFLIHQWG